MLEIFDNICILLAKVNQKHEVIAKQVFAENHCELSTLQFSVMYTLYKGDNINLSELSERCFLNNSTLTNVIDKLESLKLVERHLDPDDRRAYKIKLTQKGIEIKELSFKCMRDVHDIMLKDLPKEELKICKSALLKMFNNM